MKNFDIIRALRLRRKDLLLFCFFIIIIIRAFRLGRKDLLLLCFFIIFFFQTHLRFNFEKNNVSHLKTFIMYRLQIVVPCVRDFVNFRSLHFRSLAIQKGFEFGSLYLFIALRKFLEILDLNSFSLNLHVSLRT